MLIPKSFEISRELDICDICENRKRCKIFQGLEKERNKHNFSIPVNRKCNLSISMNECPDFLSQKSKFRKLDDFLRK